MVELPADKQLAATEVIVGTAGVDNCDALLKLNEANDVHPPLVAVTV